MNHRAFRVSILGAFAAFWAACSGGDPTAQGGSRPSPVAVISEIMYHPVDENAPVENHEFLEIFNRSDSALDVSGWKLAGDVQYTFPDGASIPPFGYKVVAKNRTALAGVSSYMLSVGELQGDYTGELGNGGGTVKLYDAGGALQDSVTYDDKFPWPYGADALGADDQWLSMLPMPTTQAPHQYRGRSLERVNYDVPSNEVSNWVPSPLDGATPGRMNSVTGAPPTIVQSKLLRWSGSDLLIRAADTVKITVNFSTLGQFSNPQLEWFVDNVQITGEPTAIVPLEANGGSYEVTLPPQANNSIVRYRIIADRGRGPEVISPRPSDPFTHWAYFVTPPVATTEPLYQLFIKKEHWNQIYDNVNYATDDRRVMPGGSGPQRCTPRPSWDAEVPAVFVSNGIVYDTFVRYQGSRWNRTNGVTLDVTKTTISPLPDRPAGPYRVFSWKVDFPAYARLDNKRSKIVLNKMNQACPGLDDTVGERLYADPMVGVPVQHVKFARFHINGGYYHYMMERESSDGVTQRAGRKRSHGDPTTIPMQEDAVA